MPAERLPTSRPWIAAVAWLAVSLGINVAVMAVYMTVSEAIWPSVPPPGPKPEMEVTWVDTTPEVPPQDEPEDKDKDKDKPKDKEPELALNAPKPPPPEPPKPPAPVPPKPPEAKKLEPPKPPEPPKPVPPKPEVKKPELPKPKPPEIKEPPKPTPVPEPPKPPPQEVAKPKPLPKPERHKMVEVDDDQHLVNEPPPDAEYWSDKNRRVAEQTRDTRTNLERMSKGEASPSEKSDDRTSEEVGGEKQSVHQLENTEASSLEKKPAPETGHSGKEQVAKGIIPGEKGQEGKRGERGDKGTAGTPGALSMRNVEGKGAPGNEPNPNVAKAGANDDAPEVAMSQKPGEGGPSGKSGREGPPGAPGKRGPKLDLDLNDYKRIAGDQKMKEEIALAKRQTSHKKGRWEQKVERIHQSLENFTPEVKPGNQTALGTRAAPFAVFIARMHRNIHELWGFGFLEELDGKPLSNPMNDRKLAVTLEIVINADGSIDKATIVKPSGVLTFDVAAIDTVYSAGPYQETPAEIRSGDGKTYLHWTFHRDERQCTPYYADPFILDNAGSNADATAQRGLPEVGDAIAARHREGPEKLKRGKGSPEQSGAQMPHVTETHEDKAAVARAAQNAPTPDDPAAQTAAIQWASSFEKGDVAGMVAVSSTPFKSAGNVVASDAAALAGVYRNVLGEVAARKITEWKLLSSGGYRAVFGHLPKGADTDGTQHLFLAVRVGAEWLTMDVVPSGTGKFVISGLTR